MSGEIPRMSSSFTALGVIFDLSRQTSGAVLVRNKPERADRAHELVEALVRGDRYAKHLAETLRGVLGFARAQCFGRCGAVALRVLSDLAAGRCGITEEVAGHLRF